MMSQQRLFVCSFILVCGLFISIMLSLTIGGTGIPFMVTWKVIWSMLSGNDAAGISETTKTIVTELRLPRVLLASVVGASLALAGVIYQALLRNILADPYILGISTGSAVGAVLAIIMGWWWFGLWTLACCAFVGALLSLWLVLNIARGSGGYHPDSLILAGVVVNAALGATLALIISLAPEQLQRIQFWLLGDFAFKNWLHVLVCSISLLVGLFIAHIYYRELNIFTLGDRSATHLGINVEGLRFKLLLVASLLTGASVAMVGAIGFVGLVIPHMIRMSISCNHRILIPLSTLAGAIFLVLGDWLARIILHPVQLPVGIITAIIGTPIFIFILKRRARIQ